VTPEAIEAALADFRSWLHELTEGRRVPPGGAPAPVAADEARLDLHALLAQLTALRHEVNLHTKATRAQQEQNAATLGQLGQALEELRQARRAVAPAAQQALEEQLRPALKALVDLWDALGLARREVQRMAEALGPALDRLTGAPPLSQADPSRGPHLTGLAGWLSRARVERQWAAHWERQAAAQHEWHQQTRQAAEQVRQVLDSLATGYGMSLQRVERALLEQGLEPIAAAGQPFDPERMEVLEAVTGSGRPVGDVLEEVRRGYLWRGRVFRYAQVRVARD
jgi:molecular chaperone GrpE